METEAFNNAQKPDTEDEDEDKVNLPSSKKSNTRLQRFSIQELQQCLYLSKIKELSSNKEFLVLNEEKYVYQSSHTCNTCERALQRKEETCDTCTRAKPTGAHKTKIPVPVCDCSPCDCDPCSDSPFSKPTNAHKSLCSANEYLREHPPESDLRPKSPYKGNKLTLEDLSRGPRDVCAMGQLFKRERVCKPQGGEGTKSVSGGGVSGGGVPQVRSIVAKASAKSIGSRGRGQGKSKERVGKGKVQAKGNVNKNKGGKVQAKPPVKNGYGNLPCWEIERLQELKQRERERLAAGLPIKYVATRKPTARIN